MLPDIEGYKFTAPSKVALVQRLSVAVEQRRVQWPAARSAGGTVGQSGVGTVGPASGPSDWSILTAEMKRYEYAIGPSGSLSYSAPAGYHDDCVMALALANHGRWEAETCGHIYRLGIGYGRSWIGSGRRRGRGGERCLDG